MKRFIDLRGQDTGYRFAWWDTVRDVFESFDGEHAWNTWDEFEPAYVAEQGRSGFKSARQRYLGLCPSWVFEPEPVAGNRSPLVCNCGHTLVPSGLTVSSERIQCPVCLRVWRVSPHGEWETQSDQGRVEIVTSPVDPPAGIFTYTCPAGCMHDVVFKNVRAVTSSEIVAELARQADLSAQVVDGLLLIDGHKPHGVKGATVPVEPETEEDES
jgi:hypothetical protein